MEENESQQQEEVLEFDAVALVGSVMQDAKDILEKNIKPIAERESKVGELMRALYLQTISEFNEFESLLVEGIITGKFSSQSKSNPDQNILALLEEAENQSAPEAVKPE